jgi:hypothetical protein
MAGPQGARGLLKRDALFHQQVVSVAGPYP